MEPHNGPDCPLFVFVVLPLWISSVILGWWLNCDERCDKVCCPRLTKDLGHRFSLGFTSRQAKPAGKAPDHKFENRPLVLNTMLADSDAGLDGGNSNTSHARFLNVVVQQAQMQLARNDGAGQAKLGAQPP